MRKLSMLLVGVILITLCCSGCAMSEVTITKDNFNDYFNVNVYADNFYETSSRVLGMNNYKSTCNLNISITPKSRVKVENLDVTFRLSFNWDIYDKNITTENYTRYLKVSIPSNGEYKTVLNCSEQGGLSMASMLPNAYFEDANGVIKN